MDAGRPRPPPAAAGSRTRAATAQPSSVGPGADIHAAGRPLSHVLRATRGRLTVLPARSARRCRPSSTRRSSTGPAPRSATRCTRRSFGVPVGAGPDRPRRRVPAAGPVQAVRVVDGLSLDLARAGAGGSIVADRRVVAGAANPARRRPSPRPSRRADQRRRRRRADRGDRRARRRPARPRRDRDPRPRLARRAGLRLDRLPRQRDGVDLGADRRVRAAQGARAGAPPAARCGCRSRT